MAREIIHDHLQQIWAGIESAFGEGTLLPQATDAIDHISIDTPIMAKRVIPNQDQTGNRGARPAGRGAFDPVAINILAHLKGSGSATTPPDFSCFLRAGGFTETIGSSVVYSRTLLPEESAWMWAATRDGAEGKMFAGIVVNEIQIPDAGSDFARIQFAANASHIAHVYKTTVGTGGIDGSSTSLPLASGHGWVIGGTSAFVVVDDGANSEVMRVTAVEGNTATVVRDADGNGAHAFSEGATIRAYFPSRTVAATNPIGETLGSFAIDDGGGPSARKFIRATLSVQTGVTHLDKEAFSENRNGMVGMRYGEEAARLTVDLIYTVGADGVAYLHRHRNEGGSLSVTMTLGTTTGNRCVISMPTAQVVDLDAPNAGDGPRNGTVTFGAYSTDGNDITIAFN